MSLKTEEARLLALLLPLENEASRLLQAYDDVQDQLESLKVELEGVRATLLEDFLIKALTPLALSFTIYTSDKGEILVSIIPVEGGELEFEKLKNTINFPDTNSIPVFYVLNYLGKGLPYG